MKNPDTKGPFFIACVLFGCFLASSYEPPIKVDPALTLKTYLDHCYEAQRGSPREQEAFKKVFNGRAMRFAGECDRVNDNMVIVFNREGYWLYVESTMLQDGYVEFDCKIIEFNRGMDIQNP